MISLLHRWFHRYIGEFIELHRLNSSNDAGEFIKLYTWNTKCNLNHNSYDYDDSLVCIIVNYFLDSYKQRFTCSENYKNAQDNAAFDV